MKTIAIFINSLRQFLVDIKIHIFVFLVAPFLIALMYGSIYKNILDPNRTLTKFTVAYIDLDKNAMSKPLKNIFTEEKIKNVVNLKALSSKNNINNSLIDGTYSSAIVIPADFSKNIRNGKPVSIEVLKSPSAGVNGDIVYDIVNAYCSYLNTNNKVYSVILNNTKNADLTQKIFNAVLPVIDADLNRSYLTITPLAKAKVLDSSQEFSSNMLIMFSIFIGVNYGSPYSMIPIVFIHALLITSITAILISLFKNTTVMGGLFSFIILLMTSISGGFYPSQNVPGFMRVASHFTFNYWLKDLYSSNMMGDTFLSLGNVLVTILILSVAIISLGAAKYKYTD